MTISEHAAKFHLELFPETDVYIALFKDVKNVDEVKKCITAGTIDAVILSPRMILDPLQVLVAANKALHLRKHKLKMHTRNINSEVLFNLSPTNNISASFKRFGFSGEDTGLLVATLEDEDSGAKMAAVASAVRGEVARLAELTAFTDKSLIKQVYKIEEEELSACSILDAVISRMASKELL